MLLTDSTLLDEMDIAIIEHLQEDGRKSFTEIAKALNVAPNTIRSRVNRLINDELLIVVAGVNARKIGVDAFAGINIAVEPPYLDNAIKKLTTYSEVLWIAERTGSFDLAVDVICRDMDHLHEFIHDQLGKLKGITKTDTTIYLKHHKNMLPPIRDLIRKGN